jgi:hypothetical protein
MSSILFGATVSLVTAATPSTGWLVAYDTDGTLKQKDSSGVISPLGGGGGLSGGTLNYVTKWSSVTTISSTSSIYDNGNVGINSTASTAKFYVFVNDSGTASSSFNITNSGGSIFNVRNDGHVVINGLNVGRGPSNLTQNTVFGVDSLRDNTTGSDNVGIGYQTLQLNTTGIENVALGSLALQLSNASYNTALGFRALRNNTTGGFNVAIGHESLFNTTTGNYNISIGTGTLRQNTIGTLNTAIGYEAGFSNTSGFYNVLIGYQSGFNITSGYTNVSIGDSSMWSINAGYGNTSLGYSSAYSITDGINNTSIGFSSQFSGTTGSNNTSIGINSLFSNTDSDDNVAVGAGSLFLSTLGKNTAVGANSGSDITSGEYNTIVGWNTGLGIDNGSYNTVLGANITGINNGITGSIWIGDGYGNVRIYSDNLGRIGISTTLPNVTLDVSGDFATRHNSSPIGLSASNDDFPTVGYSFLRLDSNNSGNPCEIWGFADGYNGKRLTITNSGPDPIRIKHLNSSTPANTIKTGNAGIDWDILDGDTTELIYDGYDNCWKVINY